MTGPQSSKPPLIGADRLAASLNDQRLVVLDASWYLPASGRDPDAEFRAAHIPGAVRFDLEKVSDPTSDLPHMLPTASRFAAACEQLGIGRDHWVVVYDGSGVNLSAARVWWMFRVFGHQQVSVLDGGFRAWASATRPVQMGVQHRGHTGYPVPAIDDSLVIDKAGIDSIVSGERDAQLIDCRSVERFKGEVGEPREGLARGHIGGSVNLPFTELTNRETGCMWKVPILVEMLQDRRLDLSRQIVATCGSGVSACVLALAVEVIRNERPGFTGPPVAVYDASWAEYGRQG